MTIFMRLHAALILLVPVMINAQDWFTSGQKADLMVSGVGFNNAGGPLTFNHPSGLASDGTSLLMCDRFNNRVLIWKTAPSAWNALPDLVLGQPGFTTNDPGDDKDKMNWPGNVSVAKNGRLAVADTENDRILLWNSFPSSNGQAADISIHFPTVCPQGVPQVWAWPWGVWTDGTRVAAVATMGAVILFWNTFPATDDQAPDYVLSNPKFGTPRNISTDGSTYFFTGDHNARVNGMPGTFFWNSYPSSGSQPYDFYRNEWVKGTVLADGRMVASGLRQIYTWGSVPVSAGQGPDLVAAPACYENGDGVDVAKANSRIYVCNYNGNSVLAYSHPPAGADPDPDFALGVRDFDHNTLDSIGYIQNPSFSTDGTRLIATSDFDRTIYIYDKFPDADGRMPDHVISTRNYDLAPWDNALFANTFVAVGRNKICIWDDATNLGVLPSRIFSGSIGTAALSDLKGVALDGRFFYIADRNGKVYIWNGIPAGNTVNPAYTIDLGNVQLNRLSSDGTYLCITRQSPPAIFVHRVSDIAAGNLAPWKTVSGTGFLNLPSEAFTFNGSLAVANMSFHDVLLWKDISKAPDPAFMTVLGNAVNSPSNKPAIGENRLFMPGALLYDNGHLWVGEHKFSSRILRFSEKMTVSADSPLSVRQMEVWPVPADHEITVTGETVPSRTSYRITDLAGRTVGTGHLEGPKTGITIGHLPRGMYFLQADKRGAPVLKFIRQ